MVRQPFARRVLSVLVLALAWPLHAVWGAVACTGTAPPAAKAAVEGGLTTWNSIYGADVLVESCAFTGAVTDVDATADDMLRAAAVPTDATTPGRTVEISTYADIAASESPAAIQAFRDALAAQLAVGDLLVSVRLADQHSGAVYDTLLSIDPAGARWDGAFPLTARVPSGAVALEFDDVCKTVVATTYLWGSPAETFKGCVRVTCNEHGQAIGCVVTETSAFGGFFADAKIVPAVGTPGKITGPCCDGFFNYAWATGFKAVEVAGGGVKLKITGHIGQSGNGGFTVTDCCSTCKLAPAKTSGSIQITAQNKGSGLSSIMTLISKNADVSIPPFLLGTTSPVVVSATKVDPAKTSQVELEIEDLVGNVTTCDPVIALVTQRGKPVHERFGRVPQRESTLTVTNGAVGLRRLEVQVNGVPFEMRLKGRSGETRSLDLSRAMRPGDHNVVELTAPGRQRGSATVVLHD